MVAAIPFSLIGAGELFGQQPNIGFNDLSDGDRVRISLGRHNDSTRVGTFRGTHRDSLVLEVSDRSEVFAFSDLSGLEFFVGKDRHSLAGSAFGLGVGLGVMALRALTICPVTVDDDCVTPPVKAGLLPGVNGGIVVAATVILGAVVGTLLETDRWQSVPWPPGARGAPTLTGAKEPGLTFTWRIPI